MLVTTTYLELAQPSDIRPARIPARPVDIVRVGVQTPEFSRFLYTAVGGDLLWISRLGWSYDRWIEYLAASGTETWVAWVDGSPAGYAELGASVRDGVTHTEVRFFGLLRAFRGMGLGGHLLAVALGHAWTLHERHPSLPPVGRVWLHTDTTDGPYALANYQARGLTVFRTVDADEDLPDSPPGPWSYIDPSLYKS